MDAYKHKSGAQKRKERQKKLDVGKKGCRTLFDVGIKVDVTGADDTNSEEISPCFDETPNIEESKECERCNLDELTVAEGSTPEPVSKEEHFIEEHETPTPTRTMDTGIGTIITNSDLGLLKNKVINSNIIETFVKMGPPDMPPDLPNDGKRAFPKTVLFSKRPNGESVRRDWLVWSDTAESLFCFPCRLFDSGCGSEKSDSNKSVLLSNDGWKKEYGWRKLYEKLPTHERSTSHKNSYIQWRELERRLNETSDIHSQLDSELASRTKYWKEIFQRLLSVVMFLGERGLAFRGTSERIGDPNNGNFLGLIELLSEFDPLLREHISKIKKAQEEGKRLQAHYLSKDSQNEFIQTCGARVRQKVLEERKKSKYFSIIADSTPDVSHTEQTTLVLRYVLDCESEFKVTERFLSFVDCNQKTGQDVANLIMSELEKNSIPLKDCRGQGYDNGANMAGVYNGAQAVISKHNNLAFYSNCAAHGLNLCGVNAAECCEEVITFFGMLQKTYNFFSRSPQRWKYLEKRIGCSLHNLSQTRWSARVDSVRPFVKHLPLIIHALNDCKELNLTAECKTELKGVMKYLRSFECIIMSTIWLKVLVTIDHKNKVLQTRSATLDIETKNIGDLIEELKDLRSKWCNLYAEAKLVAANMTESIECEKDFKEKRLKKRKIFHDETRDCETSSRCDDQTGLNVKHEEENFRINVFYKLIDSIIGGLTQRFQFSEKVSDLFQCLWTYHDEDENEIEKQCLTLCQTYKEDIDTDIFNEIKHLKSIHKTNLGETSLQPLQLLNALRKIKLDSLFPNTSIAIRLFCCIPVSVSHGERSFSVMKRIKSVNRSTMNQDRMNDLSILAMEPDLARSLKYDDIIDDFARKRARRVVFS